MTDRAGSERIVIAIDGPSGSGKSTVSRRVASALGLRYLDSGSLYRALTWSLLAGGVDISDERAVSAKALTVALEAGTDPDMPTIAADGTRIDREIRGDEVTAAVSAVSAVPAVRHHLLDLQRSIIGDGGIVVEGRDIGSVVAPNAEIKVFLTASEDARALRRSVEVDGDLQGTLASIARRDRLDSTRTVAPLLKAPGAIEIDSTSLDIDGVVARVLHACAAVVGHPRAASQGASSVNGSPSA